MSRISPPSRASEQGSGSVLLDLMQVQTRCSPMGWQHVFPLPNLSHFESERRNQKHTLSKKRRGRGGNVLLSRALQLFIKARSVKQPPEHLLSPWRPPRLPFCLLHTAGQWARRPRSRQSQRAPGRVWSGVVFPVVPPWMIWGRDKLCAFIKSHT